MPVMRRGAATRGRRASAPRKGTPARTAASQASGVPWARAMARSSSPRAAMSVLLAVTTGTPDASARRTNSNAGNTPPITSMTTSKRRLKNCARAVAQRKSRTAPRLRRVPHERRGHAQVEASGGEPVALGLNQRRHGLTDTAVAQQSHTHGPRGDAPLGRDHALEASSRDTRPPSAPWLRFFEAEWRRHNGGASRIGARRDT